MWRKLVDGSRAVLTRLALIVLGLVLSLLLIEALLQVGALYTGATGPGETVSWLTKGERVLCLGDSNTYGFYLKRPEAYPQILQDLWNAVPGAHPIEVLNLGMPGSNSSRIRKNFSRIVRTFLPDVVLVMIGANDNWTVPVPLEESKEKEGDLRYSLWRRSRVFRLLYMIRRAIQHDEVEVSFAPPRGADPGRGVVRYGGEEIDLSWTAKVDRPPDWWPGLRNNLAAIAAEASKAGVRLVFLTYPSEDPGYAPANGAIRTVAAQTGTPIIDLGKEFRKLCPNRKCSDLFFPDQHPTAKGHQIAATIIRERLLPQN